MTDEQRATRTTSVVTLALAALRDDDRADVNQLFTHAVHDGCTPAELLAEIVAQTRGAL